MAREYLLTKDAEDIQGKFWIPGNESDGVQGIVQLRAGRNPRFETVDFRPTLGKLVPGAPAPSPGTNTVLKGHDAMRAWFAPSRRIFHAHDDNGHHISFLNCHSSHSKSTLAKIGHSYDCQAAIFGAMLDADDLFFDGIHIRFDHQDKWLGRAAFGPHQKEYNETGEKKRPSKITIPFSPNSSIDLQLSDYQSSHFFMGWSIKPTEFEFHMTGFSYLSLMFASPRSWDEVGDEMLHWSWFFSLAMRTTSDVEEVSLRRHRVRVPIESEPAAYLPVWLPRNHSEEVLHPSRHRESFHFTFDDIESEFAEVIGKWQSIQEPWAAVLHRFFATTAPRDLSIHEVFLSLTQSVESLHRVRTGKSMEFRNAVLQSYTQSPAALQAEIGDQDTFVAQVHKSRNYWTHFGKPDPSEDPNVLDEDGLLDLNEKLRWVVETAILREIGIPDRCVAKVWASRWKQHTVEYS